MSWRDDEVLDAIAGRRPNVSGWIRANCPFCEGVVGKQDTTQALGVHATRGFYTCWRCNTRGRLRGYDDEDWDDDADRDVCDDHDKEVGLPDGFVPLYDAWTSITAQPAVEYLRSRGVSGAVAAEVGIGACFSGFYAERVVIPVCVLGERGELLSNWVARSWNPREKLRYRYAPGGRRDLFNARSLGVTTDVPMLVVEGVFDALPYWPNVVACLGKPTDEHVEQLKWASRPIVVALDADAAPEAEALAMTLQLTGKRASWLRLPAGKDPASVDKDELWSAACALAAMKEM